MDLHFSTISVIAKRLTEAKEFDNKGLTPPHSHGYYTLRIEFEGAVYHITPCGSAGAAIFSGDEDRLRLLDVLREAVERFGWICHAYCLMSNHYHLLVETRAKKVKEQDLTTITYTKILTRR